MNWYGDIAFSSQVEVEPGGDVIDGYVVDAVGLGF